MPPALFPPAAFHTLYDFVALLPEPVHFHDFFGRMLQVAVEDHGAVPACFGKAGSHGCLLSKVAGKADATDRLFLI